MAVNIIMEKSTFTGRDSSGKEHYRAVMLADTTDELPAREWNGIVLEQGSSITSIGEGAEYMMNSAGAWVRQGGGAPEPTLIEKTITENGEYDPADDDADGYSSVSVDVEPNLTTKSITANGTYTAATDDADGYSEVTVNVPAPTPETYEVNITYDVTNAGGGAVTSSKTYSEILSAINAGKSITGTLTLIYEPTKGRQVTATTPIYGAYAGAYGNIDTPNEYLGIAFAIKPYYEVFLGEDFGISLLVRYDNTWLIPHYGASPTYGERLY